MPTRDRERPMGRRVQFRFDEETNALLDRIVATRPRRFSRSEMVRYAIHILADRWHVSVDEPPKEPEE